MVYSTEWEKPSRQSRSFYNEGVKTIPTEQEVKDWYNELYTEKGADTMRPFEAYKMILDYLPIRKGQKLLDVGCGTGHLLRAAHECGLETYGVDISEEAVKVAQKVSPESHISVSRGETLAFDDHFFDFVTCLGSLEHFLDMNQALQMMQQVAKRDAHFCIIVPNINYIYWKFSKDVGTNQQSINENLMSLQEWRQLFQNNNFEILQVDRDRWFLRKTRIFSSTNPIQIVKKAFFKLAWALVPLNVSYQFVFILKQK